MNKDFISWMLIVEIVLPFVIINLILLVVIIRGGKKSKTSVRGLIAEIKNNEDKERSAILAFLTNKIQLEKDTAQKIAKKILSERKFLFRNLISGVLDKNADAIRSLEDDLSRITSHYHNLDIVKSEQAETPAVDTLEFETKIQELKKEIKGLKHEVHITLTTLNNIFSEFSSMFGEEVPDREMSVDQIITAMESFSGKGAVEELARTSAESADEDIDAILESESMGVLDDLSSDIENAVNSIESISDANESIDDELDDIESALDGLELGQTSKADDDEPNWDEAFEESGDAKSDKK